MSQNEIHENDVGTVFEVTLKDGDTVVDVSGATDKKIIFRKGDQTTVSKTAAFTTDGTDGKIRYISVAGDLTPAGKWTMQAYVESVSGKWHSDKHHFTVYKNLV
jgi:hypothetical protein